ncbi:MAG: IclR family transcriptional regulator [Burkholderiales bacterium]|nr:IclR family transcriptional regulator [Burkholderiales bacterium]
MSRTASESRHAMKSSLARMLGVLDLFSEDEPVWTVDAAALQLGLTRATAYRYVGELCGAGLLMRVAQGAYSLGPRIIELDRQIRQRDPLLAIGGRVMRDLLAPDRGQVILLCDLFRDKVLCTHQMSNGASLALSYTRGRPMPLFRGATAKAILAHLPQRRLMQLYVQNQAAVAHAGLGNTYDEFVAALKPLRQQGYVVSHAEVDPSVVGIGVPLFGGGRAVIGSLSIVFPSERYPRRQEAQLAADLQRASAALSAEIGRQAAPPRGGRGRAAPSQRAKPRSRAPA